MKENILKIGSLEYTTDAIEKMFGKIPQLKVFSTIQDIKGPFDGKINSTYVLNTKHDNVDSKIIFRSRISKAFRYESIVKEKILYPFLTGQLKSKDLELGNKIKSITQSESGSYILNDETPSIVPIQSLYYYYEPERFDPKTEQLYSRENTIFPYMFTVKEFSEGCSMYDLIQSASPEFLTSNTFKKLFEDAGYYLGKLHSVKFDAFYDKIYQIGSENKPSWKDLFSKQLEKELTEARKNEEIVPILPDIIQYFEQNAKIVENEKNAVIFHNDYQSQNIIVKATQDETYEISGLIDFDNWRIGPPAQDFIKMEYWTIQGNQSWLDAFYRGYRKVEEINDTMKRAIDLYKCLWFILVFNFEKDKIRKSEINVSVDARFPAAEIYIPEIEKIIKK